MAKCKQTAHEFIQDAFSPMVAVLCSHDAEQLCQKNNLSFVEMIQPFCRLSQEAAHIRDPGNIPHTLHNLRIIVKDMNGSIPQPTLARKMMSEAVANTYLPASDSARGNVLSIGNYDLQLSGSTPWFESYRDMFLQVAYPSEHEFLKHFLACIFVVSSSHVDPLDQFQKLVQQQHQQQHQSPNKLPKWFSPNVLKFYVLIHDVVDGEEAKAEAIYQSMKSTYGVNSCHLMQMNSRSTQTAEAVTQTGLPDPWSQFLPRKVDYSDSPDDNLYINQTPDNSVVQSKTNIESSVETAAEATEDLHSQPVEVIDHPLAQIEDDHYTVPRMMSMSISEAPTVTHQLPVTIDGGRPHQHGMCLTVSDHDRLRIFVHEFIVRGLIPWAERTMRVLNEQLMSRKGIHRSFFSATKKWFGSNKAPTPPGPMQNTTVVYTQEAPELQMRRFADLAFMFQQYELAYQSYHSVKRDFQNDHAWLHYAGAIEMASMSIFMQGTTSQRQYPHHYMESATSTYLNTCRSPQFATRATILSTEALKSKWLYAEAAMQLIKMTSEDSDLRSALLLEQAAHCFINNTKAPMVRKYAFHMILSGHRFSKAGQRRHALRSYSQALQVYKGKDWTLAEDHINFTIGRQSLNLKQLDNAASAFRHLLIQESKQTPAQQNAFLREYLFVYKQLISQMAGDGGTLVNGAYPQLPLPAVDGNSTKVLVSGLDPDRTQDNCVCATSVQFSGENVNSSDVQWGLLEQHIVASANGGSLPVMFKPTILCYTNQTNNSSNPLSVINETIFVEVLVQNPLRVPLVLTDIHLLWKFLPVDFGEERNMEIQPQVVTNERESKKNSLADEIIDTQVIPEITLGTCESRAICLSLTPHQTGELHIVGVAYSLGSSSAPGQTLNTPGSPTSQKRPSFISTIAVHGKQILEVQGPRMNNTKTEKTSKTYGPDRRLDLIIAPKMPLLDVRFYNFPQAMLCGEVRLGMVQFENKGQLPLHQLKVASSNPEFFTFGIQDSAQEKCVYQTIPDKMGNEEFVIDEMAITRVVDIPIPSGILNPGASVSLPMWIRGPTSSAVHQIDFLFYYESVEKNPKISYRLLHHTAVIDTTPAVLLTASAQRATSCDTESGEKDLNSLVVGVEIENLNQVHDSTIIEFSILQVSCASQKWALQHLSTRKNSDIKINPREKMIMSFKAKRCCHKADSKAVVFTNVTFDQHQVHGAATPCADFYFRSKAIPSLETLENQKPKILLPSPVSSVPKFKDVEEALHAKMTLIAIWKAFVISDSGETLVLRGQHHIHVDTLNIEVVSPPVPKLPLEQPPVKIIKESTPPKEPKPCPDAMTQLIKYTVQCNQTISHDFTLSRICILPVGLVLHNCSESMVTIEVDTKKQSESVSPDSSYRADSVYPSPCDAFSWISQTSLRIKLEPSATKELKLLAGFCLPGVYNLGTIQVQAGNDKYGLTKQKPAVPALVVVQATGQVTENKCNK